MKRKAREPKVYAKVEFYLDLKDIPKTKVRDMFTSFTKDNTIRLFLKELGITSYVLSYVKFEKEKPRFKEEVKSNNTLYGKSRKDCFFVPVAVKFSTKMKAMAKENNR